ncbi:MAG: peptidoglycan DD-metalloendopeptidase family protein [Bacteroidetes bacterium]|nr:peptidoglycan DD-metalloendopeptidase family protein [Bacteroidota bacterium]
MENQRRQKEREIEMTKKMLAETAEKQRQTFAYLRILDHQIQMRQELLGTYQNELHLISKHIDANSDIVAALEHDLASLKKEYAQLLYFMYKTKGHSNMVSFIFSAGSFNEAYKRLKFIQFYSDFRQKQFDLMIRTEASLGYKISELHDRQRQKEALINQMAAQKNQLEVDKSEQNQVADKLKGQEQDLRKQLKEKQRIAERLDRAVRDQIAKEIAAANSRRTHNRRRRNNDNDKSDSKNSATPETMKLSGEFSSNKSRLPWPVESGFVSGHFGVHEHPTIKNVMVDNKGVKIRTSPGAHARAIFGGEVAAVLELSGSGISVLVKHGEYFTIYSNLRSVSAGIVKGTKISPKEDLGVVGKNLDSGETELDFQLWQGYERLNPESWIAPR